MFRKLLLAILILGFGIGGVSYGVHKHYETNDLEKRPESNEETKALTLLTNEINQWTEEEYNRSEMCFSHYKEFHGYDWDSTETNKGLRSAGNCEDFYMKEGIGELPLTVFKLMRIKNIMDILNTKDIKKVLNIKEMNKSDLYSAAIKWKRLEESHAGYYCGEYVDRNKNRKEEKYKTTKDKCLKVIGKNKVKFHTQDREELERMIKIGII